MPKKDALKEYYNAIQSLTLVFVNKYYTKPDWFWVGDQIGTVLCVNDQFLDMSAIVNVMKLNPSVKDYHKWYFERMESIDKKQSPLTLETFLKLKS